MSSGSFRQSDVGCCFYKSDDGRHTIKCEGVVDGSTLEQHFGTKADFCTQIETFCCEHWRYCEIYRMLMREKYNEEVEDTT